MTKTLIVPMYSARNKATGAYRLLMDGNFHAIVNQYWGKLRSGKASLAIPYDIEDLGDFANAFPWMQVFNFSYKGSPVANRLHFWSDKANLESAMMLYTDENHSRLITGISTPKVQLLKNYLWQYYFMAYHMNVSSQQGISQPIDAFHKQEFSTAELFAEAFVHDQGQIDYLNSQRYGLANIQLTPKHLLYRPAYYNAIGYDRSWNDSIPMGQYGQILIPTKLNDKEYGWENRIKPFIEMHTGWSFVLTDPSNWITQTDELPCNAMVYKFTKAQYLHFLSTCPKVLYTANPRIWHASRQEFELFGCDIITL